MGDFYSFLCLFARTDAGEAVHEAAAQGDVERLKRLVEQAPDLLHHQNTASTGRSRTPLHEAAMRSVAEFLVSKGASVMAEEHLNWTPLHTAKNAEGAE